MVKTLKDIKILDTYSSDECDILGDFYNPVLELAVRYDRVTGYFSPKVLAAAARGFASAIKNHIKIRLLTSVEVDESLIAVLTTSSGFGVAEFDKFVEWDTSEIEGSIARDYLGVLVYLLEKGFLEIRVAVINENSGIFHQKIGIVTDSQGNSLSFSGSNNETVYGWTRNIEEFKVFKDWSTNSATYFASDKKNFEKLWHNESEKALVLPISDALKEHIVHAAKINEDVGAIVKRIQKIENSTEDYTVGAESTRTLRPYQLEAIDSWFKNDCASIFAMATGTGKTLTAINALKRFQAQNGYLHCVVAVPLQALTMQWQKELYNTFGDSCSLINTSTFPDWKQRVQSLGTLSGFGRRSDYIIITTYNSLQKVANSLGDKDVILLADEVHNMITDQKLEAAVDPHYRYWLGLSATPTRIWKKEDSADLMRIFGNNCYEFSIDDALRAGYLVPFNYHPHIVHLNDAEYAEYVDLTHKINKIRLALGNTNLSSKPKTEMGKELKERLKYAYLRRAGIKKNASEKIPTLIDQLKKLKTCNQLSHALIYVDNEKMLTELQQRLFSTTIITSRYLADTSLDERQRIINSLNQRKIHAVVAIRCLDEGVDIPSARLSFLLSNSTEPREYIQRLGRVLRLDKSSGKTQADVNDYLVFPKYTIFNTDEERTMAKNMIKYELKRAMFFLKRAKNATEVKNELFLEADEYGFQFEESELDNITNEGDDE